MKHVQQVDYPLSRIGKTVSINVRGKDLIIIGPNGSGKTSFVLALHNKLDKWLHGKGSHEVQVLRRNIEETKASIEYFARQNDSIKEQQQRSGVERLQKKLEDLEGGPAVIIQDEEELIKAIEEGHGIVEYFEATRQANISEAHGADSAQYDLDELKKAPAKIGDNFEKHLVNLWTRRAFALHEPDDQSLAEEIKEWFARLHVHLRQLFEDDQLKLEFDANEFRFYIKQEGRIRYSFQTLSSGYSAIFSIISRLLMRAEYLKCAPSMLTGIAVIDEIDAHLHVSLQRKVLPFLTNMFPTIQFIVTTHSPAVMASVANAVIYDIGTGEQFDDASNYSYETLLASVFNVPTTSDLFREKIKELATQLEKDAPDIAAIKKVITSLAEAVNTVDEEAAYYIAKARVEIAKAGK